jgi:hypothetical protein
MPAATGIPTRLYTEANRKFIQILVTVFWESSRHATTSSRSFLVNTSQFQTQFYGETSVEDPGCLSRIRIRLFFILDPGSEFFHPESASKNLSLF